MDIIITIFFLAVLLFSVIAHELAHGYTAFLLGDPTAKYAGRLTFNPIRHLDLFGSVILPLVLFIGGSQILVGWAKPVPINPYNLKDQRWGALKVAISGPVSNLAVAVFFGLILRFIPAGFFIAAPGLLLIFAFIVWINIILAIFNLLPIPPLDGSWILFNLLPRSLWAVKLFLQQYGILILIALVFFGGLFGLGSVARSIFYLISGVQSPF